MKSHSCQFNSQQETENISCQIQDDFRLKLAAAAHPLSVPGENTSLHVFNVPVTDVSIVSSKWVDYEPVRTGTDPIEFVIKPLADYIDINKTELRMVLKITKREGTPTGDGKKYTLIKIALHSIVKQFTIKINETLVTEQSDNQAYNAYIKTIVNFTEPAKNSYLTKALYYKDRAGHMDEVDNTSENNMGLNKRPVFTNNGTEVGLVGVPLCDIFNKDKLLLDGLEIKVKVDLNSDAFVLMGAETPNNCKLHVKHSPCPYRPCSRQQEVGTFANNAESKRSRCPPSSLHFDQNPNTCKDHSSRGIKSYGDRSFQWSMDGAKRCIQRKPGTKPFQFSTV